MAIDPRISLSYVPPQIDWSKIDPFARQQKQLTLQGLMDQQVIRQMQIQQERMQLEQARKAQEVQDRLNQALTGGGYGNAPAVQPSPEAQRPIPAEAYLYEEPQLMRPAGPEGRGPGMPFAPVATQTQPAGQFVQAGMPSAGSPFGGVDPGALIRKFGTFALPIVQKIYESQDAALKRQKTQQDVEIGNAGMLARKLNGVVNDATFKEILPQLTPYGVNADAIRHYMALGYDDPRTRDWIKSLKGPSVDYPQSVDVEQKLQKGGQESFDRERNEFVQKVQLLQDVKDFPALLSSASPAIQKFYGGLGGITDLKDLQKATAGASTKTEQLAANMEAERHNRRVEELTKAGHDATSANQIAGTEAKLRDDFTSLSKPYRDVRDAYSRIQSTLKGPRSGASDIALVFNYMKMLDPDSTVMASEQADARNAGNVPDTVRALWNRVLTGERLPENVRQDFLANAERIYGGMGADYEKVKSQFADIATRTHVDPKNVVLDLTSTQGKPTEPEKPKYQTIERTSDTPGGRVTGTITIAPPGKILVTSPEGEDFWMDADKWPTAQQRGFKRK